MPRMFAVTIPAIRSRALLSLLFVVMILTTTACGGGSTQASATPTATAIPTVALDAASRDAGRPSAEANQPPARRSSCRSPFPPGITPSHQ